MAFQSLNEILQSRFHGAVNITGIRFQLLYSLVRLFDLYNNTTAQTIQFEGIEDVDVRTRNINGFHIGNTHVQVKGSRNDQGWGWLKREKILDHFIQVFRLDFDARFVVVTNFAFKGQLQTLATYCNKQSKKLPTDVLQEITTIATNAGLHRRQVEQFLLQVSFERVDEKDLLRRLREACIQYLDIQVNNEELYVSHLLSCAITWAAKRAEVTKHDIEIERLRVHDWISHGSINPALQGRLIQPLSFEVERDADDYYEGKDARPAHIVGALDAPRPEWQRAIEEKFQRAQVCIVKASSGQGKSTLLYRYAFDHFVLNRVYRLGGCTSEEQAGQIIEYLTQRLSLGLPLLVLIDPLADHTRQWHRVVAGLVGKPIRFLVATREEDWYRYSQGISGFVWDMVMPELSLKEARSIFRYFQQQNKVAPNVMSAEWAYARVEDQKLLIEFVYFITQGQMLAERIRDQVQVLRQEDHTKLDVLRLVATTQVYGAHILLTDLLQATSFKGDPDTTLQSLQHEYIVCANGECEGLHVIRSRHLVRMLHEVISVEPCTEDR